MHHARFADSQGVAGVTMPDIHYYVRPRNFFFSTFVIVFLFLCLLEWLRKKRITRSDLIFNIFVSLLIAGFMLFICGFGLPY
jgi:hypothetical protein